MKKVLYITNVEVPYRVEFFNQLSNECDLTVLYESDRSAGRDVTWSKSVANKYRTVYLSTGKTTDSYFSLKILKYLFDDYDTIIVGCYNSPVQMFAIAILKLFRKKYVLNLDGEVFISKKRTVKDYIKFFFILGAKQYIIAGEKARESLAKIVHDRPITAYPFSSLTQEEIKKNATKAIGRKIDNNKKTVLVVGQYEGYKGLEIVVEVAKKCPELQWKFIGTGKKYNEFISKCDIGTIDNIEVIPFLQKQDLNKEYITSSILVLPSLQECWGLVINEAASFGLPIVSTWGSGAAVEFLCGSPYEKCLATPGDSEDLACKVKNCFEINLEDYSKFLLNKSKKYSIELCVRVHQGVINQ